MRIPLLGVGLAVPLLVALAAPAAAEEITVLSYNTHGLHRWISGDDPERRFPLIGERSRAYDLALFQEVFLEDFYHRLAPEPQTGRKMYRGNGPRPGPLGLLAALCGACGSGLAVAVHERLSVVSVDRKAFGSCAGKVRGGHDCWASKGFLYLRLRFPEGAELDLYDLHLDAGDRGADFRARRHQMQRIRDEIQLHSPDRAVIVAGDFNLKLRVARDRDLLEAFRVGLGLSDSLARPRGDLWREVIDYILYRSGPKADLRLLQAGEAAEFVDDEEQPLSDHPAVFARFRIDGR
jgi:endonuclease/exonuclease/phosphatase family metal-dependent hydrolase